MGQAMFAMKELQQIDRTYFNIINAGCYSVTLQSKNTKHYWHILHQQYRTFATCKIQHKHKESDAFHEQCSAPTLKDALDRIKEHDSYHLFVRCAGKKKKCRVA